MLGRRDGVIEGRTVGGVERLMEGRVLGVFEDGPEEGGPLGLLEGM
jgi:hypothetical protein